MSTSRKITSLLLAACFGITLGACGPHSQHRINKVCKRYCERVLDCNDNTDFEDCIDTCIDDANSCESDGDIEDALDILDECSAEACNDVVGCTVEAWLECNL